MSEDSSTPFIMGALFILALFIMGGGLSQAKEEQVTIYPVVCSTEFTWIFCQGEAVLIGPISFRVNPARAEVAVFAPDAEPEVDVIRNCAIFDAENWKCGLSHMKNGEMEMGPGVRQVWPVEFWIRKAIWSLETRVRTII